MKGQLRIDTMYAFIVLDDDGTEGIPAISSPGDLPGHIWMLPLVGADMARMDSLRSFVQTDPGLAGKRITLAKFTTRDNLEVIDRTAERKPS